MSPVARGKPVKLSELKSGSVVVVTHQNECLAAGARKRVRVDATGLWVRCENGKHYLDAHEPAEGLPLAGFELLEKGAE